GVGLMALAWQGKVQADGSVLFEGAGMLSASHLISMTPDRTLEIRAADVQDGVLVSLSDPLPTDRYVDNDRRTENTSATKNGKATAAASTLASNTSKTNSHRDYQATNASEASGAESS